MAVFCRFEDIGVWQEGRTLVTDVYALTRVGEFSRDFGLRDQIQRAVVSICSNVAEGFERRGNKEFIKYLWIAKGSAAEVSSQLYNALDLHYVNQEQFEAVNGKTKKIGAMIHNLIESIPDPDRVK